MSVCVRMHAYVCTREHTHTTNKHAKKWTYIKRDTHKEWLVVIWICIVIYIYIYTSKHAHKHHTHTHTHIYIYIYKYIWKFHENVWNILTGVQFQTITLPPDIGWIVSVLSVYEDRFGFKYPRKIDMPLKKETKPNCALVWKF